MKVLVTGSEGYIGTELVPMLQAEGHDVTRLDSLLFSDCAISEIAQPEKVWVKDIRDLTVSGLEVFDAIIHLAGLSNDPLSDLDPAITREINHIAAVALADMAKKAGVGHFIFSSTCSVYGCQGDDFITETSPTGPLTIYAVSKLDAEKEISALAGADFKVTHLRHGTAYGCTPMTRFDLVVNNLVAWAKATGKVHLKSDGSAWRPLVHVGDISASFVAALNEDVNDTHPVRVFNIGNTRDNLKVLQLAGIVADEMDCELEFASGAGPDTRSYRVDCSKAETSLPGFDPRWRVPEGIRQVIETVNASGVTVEEVEGHRYGRIAHLRHLLDTGVVSKELRRVRASDA